MVQEEKSRRTKNALESSHGRLEKKAGKANPNLLEFVDLIKEQVRRFKVIQNLESSVLKTQV